MSILKLLFALFVVLVMTEPSLELQAADETQQAGYDRPVRPSNQSHSVAVALHGMVATSHPLAAQTGLDVLKSGGNAADAAIAVNAMLGVVEPMSNGIGGDLFPRGHAKMGLYVGSLLLRASFLWPDGCGRLACAMLVDVWQLQALIL